MPESVLISQLLLAWTEGDENALNVLIPLVEKELRHIAASHLRGERQNHTLQTTALVNETFLRLVKQNDVPWQSRIHFFAIASRIMRRILIDYARSQNRQKRGGPAIQVELNENILLPNSDLVALLALDEALNGLAKFDPIKAQVVEMRHFGGLSVDETAEILKVAPVTVMRHWSLAKAWLRRELRNTDQSTD